MVAITTAVSLVAEVMARVVRIGTQASSAIYFAKEVTRRRRITSMDGVEYALGIGSPPQNTTVMFTAAAPATHIVNTPMRPARLRATVARAQHGGRRPQLLARRASESPAEVPKETVPSMYVLRER